MCYTFPIRWFLGKEIKMNSIIDSVSASRRLKIFTAYYAMMYVVINLIFNLILEYVAFFGAGVGRIAFKAVTLLVQAPFMFGLVRGIITKEYSISKALGAFGEAGNYPVYAVYIVTMLAYDVLGFAIAPMGSATGTVLTVGTVLFVAHAILKFFVGLFLVKLYFDSIDSRKLSIGTTLKSCGKLLSKKPMKFVGAELFMLVVSGISMVISSTVANILPAHWTVSLIITCINSVQYGFIILSWPVYYLYYRWAFEE